MEPEDLEGVPVDEARARVLDFLDEFTSTVRGQFSSQNIFQITSNDGTKFELRVADLYTLADHSRK